MSCDASLSSFELKGQGYGMRSQVVFVSAALVVKMALVPACGCNCNSLLRDNTLESFLGDHNSWNFSTVKKYTSQREALSDWEGGWEAMAPAAASDVLPPDKQQIPAPSKTSFCFTTLESMSSLR